jgi:hypothetical protein
MGALTVNIGSDLRARLKPGPVDTATTSVSHTRVSDDGFLATQRWRSRPRAASAFHASQMPELLFGGIGRLGGRLQLSIDLIEQVLSLLSVTLHVPFIGLLRRNDLFVSLRAQPLCGSEIGMSRGGDIFLGRLGNSAPNQKQGAGKDRK